MSATAAREPGPHPADRDTTTGKTVGQFAEPGEGQLDELTAEDRAAHAGPSAGAADPSTPTGEAPRGDGAEPAELVTVHQSSLQRDRRAEIMANRRRLIEAEVNEGNAADPLATARVGASGGLEGEELEAASRLAATPATPAPTSREPAPPSKTQREVVDNAKDQVTLRVDGKEQLVSRQAALEAGTRVLGKDAEPDALLEEGIRVLQIRAAEENRLAKANEVLAEANRTLIAARGQPATATPAAAPPSATPAPAAAPRQAAPRVRETAYAIVEALQAGETDEAVEKLTSALESATPAALRQTVREVTSEESAAQRAQAAERAGLEATAQLLKDFPVLGSDPAMSAAMKAVIGVVERDPMFHGKPLLEIGHEAARRIGLTPPTAPNGQDSTEAALRAREDRKAAAAAAAGPARGQPAVRRTVADRTAVAPKPRSQIVNDMRRARGQPALE